MIKTIFFDLDGTLLPMDQDVFVNAYFGEMGKKMMKYGYDPKQLAKSIWKGTYVMYGNDGSVTNEKAFWSCMSKIYGEQVLEDMPHFEDFYRNEFEKARLSCGFNPKAHTVIEQLKGKYDLILATNPIFPRIATERRIAWAGLNVDDFKYITTYECCTCSKPNLLYYKNILEEFNLNPEECIMVGNDIEEDMCAKELGMKVFLVTDCIINSKNKDINQYPHGDLIELLSYLEGDH